MGIFDLVFGFLKPNIRSMKKKGDVKGLIKALRHKDINVQQKALKALVEIGSPAVDPLIQFLNDESKIIRVYSLIALGKIGDVRAVKPLIQALEDKDSDVRGLATESLGEIGDVRAVEHIIGILENEGNNSVGWKAAIALCRIKGKKGADIIINWLFENPFEDPKLRTFFSGQGAIFESVMLKLGLLDLAPDTNSYDTIKNFFEDYGELILKSASYGYEGKKIGKEWYEFHPYLDESDDAIQRLCKLRTPISDNILHKIAQKKDIEVPDRYKAFSQFLIGVYVNLEPLRFEHQRKMAKVELEWRGNPPYDSLPYPKDEAWRIIDEDLMTDIMSLNAKGLSLIDLGKHEEAIKCFDRGLYINPKHAEAWNNKGLALINLGKHEEAIKCLNKALELNPQIEDAWINKGGALINLGSYEEAIECSDKALDINLERSEAWNCKGTALVSIGRNKEAILCFKKFIELASPQDAPSVEMIKQAIKRLESG